MGIINEDKNTIIIMMGIPKSGKTTFINNYINEELEDIDTTIVSADRLRHLIYGQDFYANGEDLVWSIRKFFLQELILQGKNIIIDENNITKQRRKPIIDIAKASNYNIVGIMMSTPLEICKTRAEKENFPLDVLADKASKWQNPTKEEGFDSVIVIDHEKYMQSNNI